LVNSLTSSHNGFGQIHREKRRLQQHHRGRHPKTTIIVRVSQKEMIEKRGEESAERVARKRKRKKMIRIETKQSAIAARRSKR